MNKIFLMLTAIAILQGCANDKTTGEGEKAASAVYEREREFTFLASHFDNNGSLSQTDTLVLETSSEVLRDSYGQTRSSWAVTGESGWKSYSGIVESDTAVWIHPPRTSLYRKLELSPFPMVKSPLKSGGKWSRSLLVGSHYSVDGHAEWKDATNERFTSSYEIVGQATLPTILGLLACYEVDSFTESSFERTALKAFYHQDYGFVRLEYDNIDKGRIVLELIKVKSARPEPVSPFAGLEASRGK
ncbi:hypothetical protein [Pontibacter rugosus]|uniref:Lipoprotein n=1 Tax=Pontibacter rugosus TaxID=1745966 RepID=A0ABW3SVF4_9BACT